MPVKRAGITKVCQQCRTSYYVSPSKVKTSHYCGKVCADAAQTGERKTLTCSHCDKSFTAKKDHGKWPKFCSRTCFEANAPAKPTFKNCPICNKEFFAERSVHTSDGLRTYCSRECTNKALKLGEEYKCTNCGSSFYRSPARHKEDREEFCSKKCMYQYKVGDKTHSWKGGYYVTENSRERFIRRQPKDPKSYIGEHRVIAAKIIGRPLLNTEYVIRLDRRVTSSRERNNDPSNLFICKSIPEFCEYRDGKRPWPTKSNLETYLNQ